MIDADRDAFGAAFDGLRVIFPLRGDRSELGHIARLYFRALSGFAIGQVEAGAEQWTATGTRFPKPSEWKAAIPRGGGGGGGSLRELDPDEAAEHRRALALYYEGEPCRCFLCTQAGVTHRMLRYLPLAEPDGRDARGLLDGKPVVRGYWAHGHELARYYDQRDAFRALSAEFLGKMPRLMPTVPRGTAVTVDVTPQSGDADDPR